MHVSCMNVHFEFFRLLALFNHKRPHLSLFLIKFLSQVGATSLSYFILYSVVLHGISQTLDIDRIEKMWVLLLCIVFAFLLFNTWHLTCVSSIFLENSNHKYRCENWRSFNLAGCHDAFQFITVDVYADVIQNPFSHDL